MFKTHDLYVSKIKFTEKSQADVVANGLTKEWEEYVTSEKFPGTEDCWRVTNRYDPRVVEKYGVIQNV